MSRATEVYEIGRGPRKIEDFAGQERSGQAWGVQVYTRIYQRIEE